jgi:hypothetical protein
MTTNAATSLETRRAVGVHLPTWPANLIEQTATAGPLRNFRLARDGAETIARTFTGETADINNDPDLSDTGRQRRRAEVASAALAKLNGLTTGVFQQGVDGVAAARRELVGNKAAKSDSAAEAVRSMEVRNWFRSLAPDERTAALRDAVNEGDVELLAAVYTAPRAMRLLQGARMQEVVAAALAPEQTSNMQALELAHNIAKTALDAVRDYVGPIASRTDSERADGFERGGAA